LADLAAFVLDPAENDEEKEEKERVRQLLIEREIDTTINAYPVYRTAEAAQEEQQGIRGKIFLIKRDGEGVEIKRILWRLIVDYQSPEE
jgi:hypothetical protein